MSNRPDDEKSFIITESSQNMFGFLSYKNCLAWFCLIHLIVCILFIDDSSCQSNWMSSERDVIWRQFQQHSIAIIIIIITMVTTSSAGWDSVGIRRVCGVDGGLQRLRRLPTSKRQNLPRSSRHHRIVRRTDSTGASHWRTGTPTGGLLHADIHWQTRVEIFAQSAGVPMRRYCARTSRHLATYDNSCSM